MRRDCNDVYLFVGSVAKWCFRMLVIGSFLSYDVRDRPYQSGNRNVQSNIEKRAHGIATATLVQYVSLHRDYYCIRLVAV
jgi:hypothetical protein